MKRLTSLALTTALAVGQAFGATCDSDSVKVEPLRPVTSSYMIEGGASHFADTYLTPLHYHGWHFGVAYQRQQAMKFNPEKWVMELYGDVSFDRALNPARNAAMWNLDLEARWGMMYRHEILPSLTLAGGGATGLKGGALYLAHNGNNPVAAKGAWQVSLQGQAVYNMNLWRLPVTFSYHLYMPAAGVAFAPDYGELYYEIYLGNHSGLANFAWWKNYFRMDNLITADLHFGATTLRLGYRCDVTSTKFNSIVSRDILHTAVIGVTTEWLSLDRRHRLDSNARIINALY